MNIKEIALKIARNMADFPIEHEPYEYQIKFAEALVAELAKDNKPVGHVDYGDRVEWYGTKPLPETDLYTLPPTAEQIAQETAEAIAKLLENGNFLSKESLIALAANGAAKAIRSGAWTEYK